MVSLYFVLNELDFPNSLNSPHPQTLMSAIVRLAGGPVVLVVQSNVTNEGLAIAALILLNVGLVPLLVTTLGLIRLM
jgi:hypothetical protein